ncbi:MAG: hypothetical protein H0U42_05185 [Thermoleophilaceae bacterium]|nr:hypothetical protein [Thermoleophilaceae bacterium]
MLPSSSARILDSLRDSDVVLDIGGGAAPFARADWVIDILPFASRHVVAGERFTEATWIARDVCDREPLPFERDSIGFVVCSHTLEDVRDPIWVCTEMMRIGKAGYIEVPSRLEEQSIGVHGPWSGWSHHRWLIDVGPREIEFVHKSAVVHARGRAHFPAGIAQRLTPEQRVQQLWWRDRFDVRERVLLDAPTLDAYLEDFVRERIGDVAVPRRQGLLRRLGQPRGRQRAVE